MSRIVRACAVVACVAAGVAGSGMRRVEAAGPVLLTGDPVALLKKSDSGIAFAISASGQVVGSASATGSDVVKGFSSGAAGGGGFLPAFGSVNVEATAVSPAGVVVGAASLGATGGRRAFRGRTLLPLIEGENDAYPYSINSANRVVGMYRDAAFAIHAAIWEPDGRGRSLSGTDSRAYAINDAGTIVGESSQRAATFDAQGNADPLPDLGGGQSAALDVNSSGTAVGLSRAPDGKLHAVMWKNRVLTDLDPEGKLSPARAVNDAGVVVGGPFGNPILWDAAGRPHRLNCSLPAGSEWNLLRAQDVNEAGVIVGQADLGDGRIAFAFHPDPNAICPDVPPPPGVQGVVEFEKIPVTSKGLRSADKRRAPVIGVTVEAATVADPGAVIGSAVTDSRGHFEIPLAVTEPVRLRVRSVHGNVEVRTRATDEAYTVDGQPFTPAAAELLTRNLLATDASGTAGAFNILDVARRCLAFVRRYEPDLEPPSLLFRWAPDRSEGTFFVDNGPNQTGVIHVNGDRSVNSDEFDDTVLAHEYGHFLGRRFSRDDSFGGFHQIGQRLDPRIAWSEGWATFFGCAATGVSSKIDSYGPGGSRARTRNLEKNKAPGDSPGIWSEHSVSSALWDLADAAPDTGDAIALSFGPIWAAFRGGFKDETFVCLLDFCDVLADASPARGPAIRDVLAARRIPYTPGASPSSPLAFPAPVGSGVSTPGVADSFTRSQANLDTSSRLFEFTLGADGPVSVFLNWESIGDAPNDLDLYLLGPNGAELAKSNAGPGTNSEMIDQTLPAGTYVVEVRSYTDDNGGGHVFNRGRFSLTVSY